MRGSAIILTCAAVATLCAAVVSGCKGSSSGVPLPGPSLAPTLPPGAVTEYPLPTANATPLGITLGADGNMWFTEFNGSKVGKVTPSGAITEYPLASGAAPVDIVKGPNSSVWFVEDGGNAIGELSTTGSLNQFPTPTNPSNPLGIAVDPTNPNRLWFGESRNGAIGLITSGGAITEYPTAVAGSAPVSVAVTSDGSVWFLDDGTDTLGKLVIGGTALEYAMPNTPNGVVSGLADLVVGPDGNLWFTATQTDEVCQAVVSALPPTIGCAIPQSDVVLDTVPFGIVSDPSRGVLWFAEVQAGQLAEITTSGSITEFGIPGSGTTAIGVSLGPDVVSGSNSADLWFTDGGALQLPVGTNQVGKANLSLFPARPLAKTAGQFVSRQRMVRADKRWFALHAKSRR